MEHRESGRRALPGWLPLAVLALGLLVTGVLVQVTGNYSDQLKARLLTQQHQSVADRINDRIGSLVRTGQLLAALSTSSGSIPEPATWKDRTNDLGIVGLEQIVSITAAQRSATERQLSIEAGHSVTLQPWSVATDHEPGPLEAQPRYLIVLQSRGDSALTLPAGIVATSVPQWRRALDQALSEQTVVATGQTGLNSGPGLPLTIRLFVPNGRDSILSLVIDPTKLLNGALGERRTPDFALSVHDLSQQAKTPLFQIAATGATKTSASLRSELEVGNRTWMITTTPTRAFFSDGRDNLTQNIWLSGIGLSILVAAGIALMGRQLRSADQRHDRDFLEISRLQQQLDNKLVEKTILKQALDNSELRSRDLVMLTGGFVCELDDQLSIAYVSPQVTDLLGEPPAELAERPFVQSVAERDRENFHAALTSARRDKDMTRIDLHLLTGSGEEVTATLRIKAVIEPISGCTGFRLTGQYNPCH